MAGVRNQWNKSLNSLLAGACVCVYIKARQTNVILVINSLIAIIPSPYRLQARAFPSTIKLSSLPQPLFIQPPPTGAHHPQRARADSAETSLRSVTYIFRHHLPRRHLDETEKCYYLRSSERGKLVYNRRKGERIRVCMYTRSLGRRTMRNVFVNSLLMR